LIGEFLWDVSFGVNCNVHDPSGTCGAGLTIGLDTRWNFPNAVVIGATCQHEYMWQSGAEHGGDVRAGIEQIGHLVKESEVHRRQRGATIRGVVMWIGRVKVGISDVYCADVEISRASARATYVDGWVSA